MTYEPTVAMCWDGQTYDAELIVDGRTLSGSPADVTAVFHALNEQRRRLEKLDKHYKELCDELQAALRRRSF